MTVTVTLNSILSDHRWEMSDAELQCLIDTQAELKRLRGIELALKTRPRDVLPTYGWWAEYLRWMGRQCGKRAWTYMDRVVRALEAK